MIDIGSLVVRIKRYLFVIILIPVILGLVGWFVPAGKAPSIYTATTTISLGSYDNADFNNPSRVMILLTHAPFYQQQLPLVWNDHQGDLLTNLQVTSLKDQLIQLSITASSKQDATQLINSITNAFLNLDKQQFEQRQAMIQEAINNMRSSSVSADTKVAEQKFLYNLQTLKQQIKPAMLLDSADQHTELETRHFSAKDRAVLGVLLGITISFIWMVFPELIQKKENRQEKLNH